MSDPKSALRAVSGNDAGGGATNLPNIPEVPSSDDSGLINILSSMKSWMEKAVGSGLTGFATKQELLSAGVLKTDETGALLSVADMRIPPVPSGLEANGAMTNILVQWDSPLGAYGNHAYTEVWAAESDNFSSAAMVGQAGGFVFAHSVGEDSVRYYWIRYVSTSGIKGPFNAVRGIQGHTAQNVSYLIDSLSDVYGTNSAAPFFHLDQPTVINGLTIPAGTYMKSAFIADGTITTAMIKKATIDVAQITGRLTANQINADQLNVTNGTFAGQLIGASGTFSGNLSAAGGTFRGELQAATGTFSGSLSAGTVDVSKLIGVAYRYESAGWHYVAVPAGYTSMRVTLLGGGGGGGSGSYGEWNIHGGGGGGGGAGQYRVYAWDGLAVGATVSIYVGPGGAGSTELFQGGAAGGPTDVYYQGVHWIRAEPGGGGGHAGYSGYVNNGYGEEPGGGGGGYPAGGAGHGSYGGNGANSEWGGTGGTGYSNWYGGGATGFGAGGAGGGYDGGTGNYGGGGPNKYNGWFPGGAGSAGRALIEFYNPNSVVLRTEFTALQGRVGALEVEKSDFWQQNKNMTRGAVGSLAVANWIDYQSWSGYAAGWYDQYGYLGGAWRELAKAGYQNEYSDSTHSLIVRYA